MDPRGLVDLRLQEELIPEQPRLRQLCHQAGRTRVVDVSSFLCNMAYSLYYVLFCCSAKQVDRAKTAEEWVISPLTGEKIPAGKLAEHMRYNTVDSQYFVQREREMIEKQEGAPIFASGVDVSSNIRAFAERRTDIFGVGEQAAEQTVIGKKVGRS